MTPPSTRAVATACIASPPKREISAFIPAVIHIGSKRKSPTARSSPRITDTTRTRSVRRTLSFSASHLSKREGSSTSSRSMASADAPSVFTLRAIISAKFTTPRTNGRFKILYFFLIEVNESSVTAREPSDLRQVVTAREPAFIITPSSTACPPTLLRRQQSEGSSFLYFSFIAVPFGDYLFNRGGFARTYYRYYTIIA